MRYLVLLVLALISAPTFAALSLTPIEIEMKIYDAADPGQSLFVVYDQLERLTFVHELSTDQIGGRLARSGSPIVKSVDVVIRDTRHGLSTKTLSSFEEVSTFVKSPGIVRMVTEIKATLITAKSYLGFISYYIKPVRGQSDLCSDQLK